MPFGGLLAMGAGGAALSGIFGYLGDKEQANAAKDAQAQNAAMLQQGRDALTGSAYTANNLLNDAMPGTQDLLLQGYLSGNDFATQGYGQQRADIMQGGALGADAIAQGQGNALSQLYAGGGAGIGYLNSGLQSGVGAIGGRTDRAGAMLDQQGGLYGNLQMDPGFDFRLKQSEDAMRRQQAAAGGRFGGAALQALSDHAQNFASNEYQNAANRRLQEYGAAQGADAQSLSAANSLAGLYGNAAGQSANMAYGMGQSAAGMIGSNANSLANIYAGTGAQLGTQAASAGQQLGGMAQGYYGNLANLNQGLASQMGTNLMNAATAGMGVMPAAIANNNSTVQYAGQGLADIGKTIGGVTDNATQLAILKGMGAF